MGRLEREYIVEEISKKIKSSNNLFLSDFTNIKAEKLNELRSKLAENSGSYFVIKNTLCKLALKKANLEELNELIDGPTSFVFCKDNHLAVSKILVDFFKDSKEPKIKGGYVEGAVIDAKEVGRIALLPSHKELLAMLVYGMKSPITSFVGVMGQLLKGLVVVVDQISKKKGEEKTIDVANTETKVEDNREAKEENKEEIGKEN